jgi:thiamine biosynthesis lipoprotein
VQHRETRPLMGTVVGSTAVGGDRDRLAAASDAAYREMARLSDMMNHYNPASVVSAINDAAGRRPVATPPELMEVLVMARQLSEKTAGAFDITVGSLRGWRFRADDPRLPSPATIRAQLPNVDYRQLRLDRQAQTAWLAKPGIRIDLGGIAKLYILRAGMAVLRARGVASAMIDGGGDLAVMGRPKHKPWRIGIRDPRVPDRLLGIVALREGYVVSSGDYERYFIRNGRRYHHILDPRTGYPTEGPRGVTLVAGDLATVNGLSAAIMVVGMEKGRSLIMEAPGLEGIIVGRDGEVWLSAGMRLLPPPDEDGRGFDLHQ